MQTCPPGAEHSAWSLPPLPVASTARAGYSVMGYPFEQDHNFKWQCLHSPSPNASPCRLMPRGRQRGSASAEEEGTGWVLDAWQPSQEGPAPGGLADIT